MEANHAQSVRHLPAEREFLGRTPAPLLRALSGAVKCSRLDDEFGASNIRDWRPQPAENNQVAVQRAPMVPVHVSRDWAKRVLQNPALCDTPEFAAFLDQHRAYVETTGDAEYINKTFNNLQQRSSAPTAGGRMAVLLMEEALKWAPWNPHNWTSYAIVLCAARRDGDAINVLWKARYRFAWNQVIRNELGRVLRETGDYETSADVLREASSRFQAVR